MSLKVSKKFKDDFDFLAEHFKWEGAELDEMKAWVRKYPDQNVPYIENLAAQWRDAEGLEWA